jgi:hypothetical protein
MADPNVTAAEQATARFVEEIGRTHKEVAAAIDAIPNPQQALDPAQEFFRAAETAYKAAAQLRAQLVSQIWEAEEMTATALADRLNVKRQRVGQIAKAHRAGKEHQP